MNYIKPSILPGFMELLPEEQIIFDQMKDIIRETFENYAFKRIETPNIEKTEILLAKGGGETTKQIYYIDHDDRDMALRFDLTVPLARYVAQYYHELSFPFRRYQLGKVYRGERNQKGRYKEFYQCDIDIIGDKSLDIHNDAEVAFIMYKALTGLKIPKITINMNNRKLLNGFLASLDLSQNTEILRVIDKVEKISEDKFRLLLNDIINDDKKIDRLLDFISIENSNDDILAYLSGLSIDNDLYKEGLDEISKVYSYMKMFGVPEDSIKINLSITRGLDYYTGMVFETFLDDYRDLGSICSGGRYDNLAGNYTSQKLPGIGMSIGLTRLYYQLSTSDLIKLDKKPYCEALVVPMSGCEEYGMDILKNLREEDIKSQIYLENKKFKKIFTYANREKINYVIVIGEDEVKNNKISLKDMKTGDQELMTTVDAIKIIKNN